jgi:MHS family proline/betaine transporter-like MFS transporter
VATLLIAWTGNDIAPAWYVVAAAVVSLSAVLASRETSREPLRDD